MNTPNMKMKWVKFYELKHGEPFYGLPCLLYYKTGPFTGRAFLDERLIFVMPWARVRSARPFGKAKPAILPLELQTCAGEGPNLHFGKSVMSDCEIPPGNTGLGGVALSEARGENEKCPSP